MKFGACCEVRYEVRVKFGARGSPMRAASAPAYASDRVRYRRGATLGTASPEPHELHEVRDVRGSDEVRGS